MATLNCNDRWLRKCEISVSNSINLILTYVGLVFNLGKLILVGLVCRVDGLFGVGGNLLRCPLRFIKTGWLCWTRWPSTKSKNDKRKVFESLLMLDMFTHNEPISLSLSISCNSNSWSGLGDLDFWHKLVVPNLRLRLRWWPLLCE